MVEVDAVPEEGGRPDARADPQRPPRQRGWRQRGQSHFALPGFRAAFPENWRNWMIISVSKSSKYFSYVAEVALSLN